MEKMLIYVIFHISDSSTNKSLVMKICHTTLTTVIDIERIKTLYFIFKTYMQISFINIFFLT